MTATNKTIPTREDVIDLLDYSPATGHFAWLVVHGEMPAGSIDHANRRRRDNRIVNLRLATPSQNIANTLARCTSKSGIKGVSWCKSTNRWRATLVVGGRQKTLGRFESLEDAAEAYRCAAIAAFGEFARTNSATEMEAA